MRILPQVTEIGYPCGRMAEDPRLDMPRSVWALPVGFGVLCIVAVIYIVVGAGYDVFGRSPPPLVLAGLAMLVSPPFLIARLNRVAHDRWVRQLGPVAAVFPSLEVAITFHGAELVARVLRMLFGPLGSLLPALDAALTLHGADRVYRVLHTALLQLATPQLPEATAPPQLSGSTLATVALPARSSD